RTKLLLAAVCTFVLPMFFSASDGNRRMQSTPFATVALAGHTLPGNWCECGTPGCICDPSDVGYSARTVPARNKASERAARTNSSPGFDLGTSAVALLLALF